MYKQDLALNKLSSFAVKYNQPNLIQLEHWSLVLMRNMHIFLFSKFNIKFGTHRKVNSYLISNHIFDCLFEMSWFKQ